MTRFDLIWNRRAVLKENTVADVFVVKPSAPVPGASEPVVWCVATDFSSNAKHALDVVLSLMAVEDKLIILHCTRFECVSAARPPARPPASAAAAARVLAARFSGARKQDVLKKEGISLLL